KSQLREEAITQALTSAVAQGNAPMVDTLLDGLKDTTDISFPFNIAVDKVLGNNAEIALLTLFLDKAPDKVSQEALEEALKKAVEKGGKKVVTCLVNKSKSQLREEAITQALTSAVAHKNALMVGTLLEGLSDKLNDVSSPFNIAVDKVLRNNVWIGLVTIFLDKAPDKVSQEVLEEALKSNDPNRKRVTAAIYEHIKPQVIGKIFEKAVDEDNTALVERVLAEGSAKLAKEVIKRAFQSACQQGHSVIVGLFLRKGEVKNKLKELISSCFNQACKDGQAAVVGSFLANAQGSVPKDTLATAIVNAINDEQNEVKDTLLAQVKEKVVVKKAWKQGIEEPNTAVVKVILAHSQAREKIDRQTVRDAFTTATTEDQTSLVQVLLSKASDKIQETAIVTELGKAVENEEGEIVNTINTMSEETLGRVLLEAVKQGEDDLVSVLLKKANKRGSDITKAFSEAVRKALTDKEETLVAEFLNKKKYPNVTIGNQAISNALTEAVENGTDAMVSVLLKEANKRGSDITKAFSKAVERALMDKEEIGLVTTFLSKKKYPNVTIGNQAISNALTKAVTQNNAPIVGILLAGANEKGSDITEAFSKAVEKYGEQGSATIISILLSKENGGKIKIRNCAAINDALTEAVAQNNAPIVGTLLDRFKDTDVSSSFNKAVGKALGDEAKTELVTIFLDKGLAKISKESIKEALRKAVEKRREEVVKALLNKANGKLEKEAITQAFTKAVAKDNAPIVGILLDEANENKSDVTEAFSKAVERALTDKEEIGLVTTFLSKKKSPNVTIGDQAINDALTKAVAQNNTPIVGILLDEANEKGSDITETFSEAVTKALADKEETFIAEFLNKEKYPNVTIEDKAISNALTKAVTQNNAPIVGVLLDEANKIDDQAIKDAFKEAVAKGSECVLDTLLTKANNKIDEQLAEEAIQQKLPEKNGLYIVYRLISKGKLELDKASVQKILTGNYYYTRLHFAVLRGDEEAVDEIINEDSNSVAQKDKEGNTPLHVAAAGGQEAIVKKLIEEKADVNAINNKGQTPPYKAIEQGHEEIVKLLIKEDNVENVVNYSTGASSLSTAAFWRKEKIVTYLIDTCKANGHTRDWDGRTPLYLVANFGHEELVKKLTESGANIHATACRDGFQTPLHMVAYFGKPNIVELLLKKDAQTGVKDRWGRTPLHNAALRWTEHKRDVCYEGHSNCEVCRGYSEVIRLLLDRGARTYAKDKEGRTPLDKAASGKYQAKNGGGETLLHSAVYQGDEKIVAELIAQGARVDAENIDRETPLHWAAYQGYKGIVNKLLEEAKEKEDSEVKEEDKLINKKNKDGETPLHLAVYQGHEEIVAELIAQGARVNAENNGKETPLHSAAYQGYKGIVEKLLEKAKGLINAENESRETPLHKAIFKNDVAIVTYLLDNGADIKKKDKSDLPLLHQAISLGRCSIVEKLIRSDDDLYEKDYQDRTPLHVAVQRGSVDIVALLLERGAKLDEKDKAGKTPLQWAEMLEYTKIVNILKNRS
ncbi:MAG: ankyrin repeat domain-containing protein, partial [Cytophagales bacterium]|nr:ankyrin repeat domain-containing protein [Cytophagales bacterium]